MCSRDISWLWSSTWRFCMRGTVRLQWNCVKSRSFFSDLSLRKPRQTYIKRNYKHLWAVTLPVPLSQHTSMLFHIFSWSHLCPRAYGVGFVKSCRQTIILRERYVLWIPCFQLLWRLTGSFMQLVMLWAPSFLCCCSSFCQSKQLMLMDVGGSLPH